MTEPQLEQVIMFCPGCKNILITCYDPADDDFVDDICPLVTEDPIFSAINQCLFDQCNCDEDYVYLDESGMSLDCLINEVLKGGKL